MILRGSVGGQGARWGRRFNISVLLMLNGTKIHLHNRNGIFGKNDMESAHDVMKTKTSEDNITLQTETTD